MYWDGPLQLQPNKRPFALHRNGYAGMQRFGWLWSGDTLSTWKALKAQITNGINVGLCGIPYWGSDTGGFVPTLEYTPELFVRWFQFSSFCPSFRSHGRAWKLHLPWGWNTGTAEPKEVAADWVADMAARRRSPSPGYRRNLPQVLESSLSTDAVSVFMRSQDALHRTSFNPSTLG